MSKHTAGPWKACRSHEDFDGLMWDMDEEEREEYNKRPYTSVRSANETVTSAHDLFEFKEADAHLVSASPDLLEALVDIVSRVKDGQQLNLLDAQKAIAKATGQEVS